MKAKRYSIIFISRVTSLGCDLQAQNVHPFIALRKLYVITDNCFCKRNLSVLLFTRQPNF